MVAILAAVLTDGLAEIEAACAEALGEGVASADVILNILARRRRNPDQPRRRACSQSALRQGGPSFVFRAR